METIDWVILAGSFLVAIVAIDPRVFLPVKRKRLELCRCFYCK